MREETHVQYFCRKADEALSEVETAMVKGYKKAIEYYKVALGNALSRQKPEIQKLIDGIKDKMKGEK